MTFSLNMKEWGINKTMTEQEQIEQNAEKYARKILSKDCCDLKLEVYKKTIMAYIAGATENGIVCHDLRQDQLERNRTS